MKRLTCLMATMMLASMAIFADIARPNKTPNKVPKPKAGISAQMNISLDREAKEARLIIPKSQIKELRAALDDMDDDSGNTANATVPGISRTQTIMGGIFLSLALVFGGMWFVRSGRAATKPGKSLVALVVVAGLASAATYIYANAGPPPEARSITGKMFSQAVHIYKSGGGRVKLEAGDDDYIKLVVPDPKDERPSE